MGEDGSLNASWRRLGRWILAIESPATRAKVQPRWLDPETRIESQTVDQFQKLIASGLGVRATAEKILGWDRETIDAAVDEAQEASRIEGDPFSLLDPVTRAAVKGVTGVNADTGAGA